MRKIAKALSMLIAGLVVTGLAGLGIKALWNSIITSICGFASITFLQSVGLFVLGQFLSGGFLFMLFILAGGIHALRHHREGWHDHWHKMTDEERREFIIRRRDSFGFRNRHQTEKDAEE